MKVNQIFHQNTVDLISESVTQSIQLVDYKTFQKLMMDVNYFTHNYICRLEHRFSENEKLTPGFFELIGGVMLFHDKLFDKFLVYFSNNCKQPTYDQTIMLFYMGSLAKADRKEWYCHFLEAAESYVRCFDKLKNNDNFKKETEILLQEVHGLKFKEQDMKFCN